MAAGDSQSAELVNALLDPRVYPDAPESVELRETHISWVFLAGPLAYKVKKPLVLPFLDYGTLARRRHMCEEEVRLNRRLAPSIYLGVAAIVRDADGYRLTLADDAAAVEFAVRMRRVDEARTMATLATEQSLTERQVLAAAALLADFHGAAAVAPPARRRVDVLEATLEENAATLRDAGAGILDVGRVDALEHFTRAFVGAHRGELETRGRAGLVRDCHGDLRAEHVVLPEDEAAYVFDCVEFNAGLRQIDVSADIAFLVMDLTRLGRADLADVLIDGYRDSGGDPGGDGLVAFFASYRAWVRAKVDCLRARELPAGSAERERAEREARELTALGHWFAWRARPPFVLAVCGLSGSGKTTLAAALAEVSGRDHFSSDVTRKRLAGLRPSERGDAALYTPERTLETYEELGRSAARRLRAGQGVIVDATFNRRAERDAFRTGLRAAADQVLFAQCRASISTMRARLRQRAGDAERVSDADAAVLERQVAAHEPPNEVPKAWRVELDAELAPAELVAAAEATVDSVLLTGPDRAPSASSPF